MVAHQDLPSCSLEEVAYPVDHEEVEASLVACLAAAPAVVAVAAACPVEGGAYPEEVALCPTEEVPPCPSAGEDPRVDHPGTHAEGEACWEVVNLEDRV